jgi:hypothetical protein
MYENLDNLTKCAIEVEHRFPMLSFKTDDDILQMKQFVRTYYQPILNDIDLLKLEETNVEKIEHKEESHDDKNLNRNLSGPKRDSHS